ncbi:cupin domain-containing protein [Asticcacaulis sp. W401b]|uniref:cupin domain-containing protein n=1 Tax=Asticcacaulis sp. W401b TaxID=3388666 RepID=UPI00397096DB
MAETDDWLAARYALGVADLSEIVAAEALRDSDPAFAAQIARYDSLFSTLSERPEPVRASDALWDRIDRAIDDVERSPDTQTVRPGELGWQPYIPGIDRKLLHLDKAAGMHIVLYKVAPGTSVMEHTHLITEECLVLEGQIEVNGVVVRAGELHLGFPGIRHGPLTSQTGALLYIRGDMTFHP